ncbi:alpha/beta fold hydrolase [Streptomyces flavidovirens]|uniref:PHA/PHB synthase family protein n=1 Tax=Streptomyces flavidovirens TaxID=67298 RepID=UPI00344572F4
MSPCGSEPYAYDDDDSGHGDWPTQVLRRTCPTWLHQLLSGAEWTPDPGDTRFGDPAWSSNPCYRRLHRTYWTWGQLALAAAEAPYLPAWRRQQVQFLAQLFTDALAPTNFLLGNPAALRRAVETRGASLVRGAGNFLDDLVRRRGRPTKTLPGTYRLGSDLAATPGRVVYRNDLMEVLQYESQTAEVHQVPLLLVPAWVNRFYIFDLAPGRSIVEWAVREGFTVFAVSFRAPGPEQAGLGLDDYFLRVPLRALDVVQEITAAPKVHLVGACAGGILTAATAAWCALEDEERVASLTFLMTAIDFATGAGNEKSPAAEISLMTRFLSDRSGIVEGEKIGLMFDLLRSTDTIWQPLVSGWLMGERPSPFDIWAWSEDGIGVPRVLLEQMLNIAADNTLARGLLRINERTIDISTVTQDAFVVAGLRDHIIPWQTVYKSAQLLGGDVAFHLVRSGHVGSIISPPRPRAEYRTSQGGLPLNPQDWLAGSATRHESWWSAWSRWLAPRSGPRIRSRTTGSDQYPAEAPAPGRYVRSR